MASLSEKTKKALCISFQPNHEEERFIDRREAIKRFDQREGAIIGNGDVAGFYLTVRIMKDFIAQIEAYNANVGDPAKKAMAIRIWQAKSYAFTGDVPDGYLVEDLVITPARTDGSDVHAFPEGETLKAPGAGSQPLLILSSSRPCPNLCGSPNDPKFFHQYRP